MQGAGSDSPAKIRPRRQDVLSSPSSARQRGISEGRLVTVKMFIILLLDISQHSFVKTCLSSLAVIMLEDGAVLEASPLRAATSHRS